MHVPSCLMSLGLLALFAISPAWAFSPESMLCRINKLRADRKLEPFGLSSNQTRSAQFHAEDMAKMHRLASTGSKGDTAEIRARQFGVKYRLLGEVIAAGYRSEDELLKRLSADPRYADYFFSSELEMLGVGYARDEDDYPYWTLDFSQLWTEKYNVPKCNADGTWGGEAQVPSAESASTKQHAKPARPAEALAVPIVRAKPKTDGTSVGEAQAPSAPSVPTQHPAQPAKPAEAPAAPIPHAKPE